MVTLVGDIHFWTLQDEVIIKDADIGAFKYQDKGNITKERIYYGTRKKYIESRGGTLDLKNNRPHKLRDSLKELEEYLTKEKTVLEGWESINTYRIVFNSGLIAILSVDSISGDLISVLFDKFLQGKLLSENIADGCFASNYLIFSYNDSRITLIHITKPLGMLESKVPFRISSQDPKIATLEGAGPSSRRFERKLSVSLKGEMLLVWWATGENEVYPWSPLSNEKDRANLLVYRLNGLTIELMCYCRTEMSPLSVAFSKNVENVILTVEQGFDKVGGVTVLSCVYEVENDILHRVSVTSIPLEAPLTAHAHNPAETRLLLACNNGVLTLHCESRGMTHVTKAGLIPSSISWLDSGSLLIVANDRGQIQCFDMALSLIRMQLQYEDSSSQRILDFSDYFGNQKSLQGLSWAPSTPCYQFLAPALLLHFVYGPLAYFRVGCGHVSYKCNSSVSPSLTHNVLVKQYIKHGQFNEAVNILVSLSWETEGKLALECFYTIIGALLKLPLNTQRESQLEAALSTFLVPPLPLSPSVEDEFGPHVRAATRRFFFKVLRKGCLEKAYRLALDLRDYDCFLNVHHVARCHGNKQLASLSLQNARELNCGSCWSGSCSSFLCSDSGDCSESCSDTCSTCCSGSAEEEVLPDRKEGEHAHNGSESDLHSVAKPNNSLHQSSEDGTITINIRQGSQAAVGGNTILQQASASRRVIHSKPFSALGPVKEVSEVSYSSDSAEDSSISLDRQELLRQYEQTVFQEIATKEDGSTVKVVHFGVV